MCFRQVNNKQRRDSRDPSKKNVYTAILALQKQIGTVLMKIGHDFNKDARYGVRPYSFGPNCFSKEITSAVSTVLFVLSIFSLLYECLIFIRI